MKTGESMPKSHWLVVNTHAHREKLAIENLQRQNFQSYCPLMRKRLRGRTGPREVLRPLFPSYLFVRVTPDKSQWRPVLSTYGVRKVVRFGDDVPYLDARFVETLQAREVDGAIVKPREPYASGQDIRIVSGPFDGLIAKIIDVRENDRLVILMDLLGQSVRGRIHADQVSPLGAS